MVVVYAALASGAIFNVTVRFEASLPSGENRTHCACRPVGGRVRGRGSAFAILADRRAILFLHTSSFLLGDTACLGTDAYPTAVQVSCMLSDIVKAMQCVHVCLSVHLCLSASLRTLSQLLVARTYSLQRIVGRSRRRGRGIHDSKERKDN